MYEKHNFKTGQVLTADVLNEMDDGIYKSSVYTTPFTLIDLATDFFMQDDGYTMPCPQELVDAVHNGLTIVMPYGLGNSGGYKANVKFSDRDICLEFLINSPLFDGYLIRMRAVRHIETDALEFIKGNYISTFVQCQPLLEPGKNIKTIAGNDILIDGNLPAKDILKESTVFLEWDQTLSDGRSVYKDRAGYEAHNLKVYKRIAPALHYNLDKIVPNTEMFFVNIAVNSGDMEDIHTGILECIGHELLHSTIFSSYIPVVANFTFIKSIGVDCELIIDAAEGGEMPMWMGVTMQVPVGSNYVKNISFNDTTYSGRNNEATLPSLMTNTAGETSSIQVDLTTNILKITTDVTNGIHIKSFNIRKGISQESRVYFYYAGGGGPSLAISFGFDHCWENGENPCLAITDACFCELTIKQVVVKSRPWNIVSLKTYKQ